MKFKVSDNKTGCCASFTDANVPRDRLVVEAPTEGLLVNGLFAEESIFVGDYILEVALSGLSSCGNGRFALCFLLLLAAVACCCRCFGVCVLPCFVCCSALEPPGSVRHSACCVCIYTSLNIFNESDHQNQTNSTNANESIEGGITAMDLFLNGGETFVSYRFARLG